MKGLVRLTFRAETCSLEQSDNDKELLFSHTHTYIYIYICVCVLTKRLLLPRNLSLSGRLEEACTTCWSYTDN